MSFVETREKELFILLFMLKTNNLVNHKNPMNKTQPAKCATELDYSVRNTAHLVHYI